MRSLLLCLPALAWAAAPAAADDDLLPADRPIPEAIDRYVADRLAEEKVKPAPAADDAAFIRRVTLDLCGRLPTPAEVKEHIESKDPKKREKLVDRLLGSPGFNRHQATELDTMLMAGTRGSVRDYLLRAVAENRPWDAVFRDLLLPTEGDPKTKGTSEFLRQRASDTDKLTAEVSIVFFGVNVSCARCHDHPLVQAWKQEHFYGMKAFFARTYDAGGLLAEREAGLVKFQTSKGVSHTAKMMFLTGKAVDDPGARELTPAEQKKEKEAVEAAKKNKTPPPAPKDSARAKLVEVALAPGERDYFARNIVNRTWHRLLGRGLVAPVDQLHAENPPSHPELLAWLARDTVEHGYDLKRLIRGVVLSETYARTSRWEAGTAPKPQTFAVARVRPLTPLQYAVALKMASTDPAAFDNLKPEEVEKRVEAIEQSARGLAPLFEQPGDDFQVSVTEALLFSNGERLRKELLADTPGTLLGRLKTLQANEEVVALAVRTVFGREADEEEKKELKAFLDQRGDRPDLARRQLVWALLTSSEMRFNY
jgi:hypothetical protein